MTTFPPAPHPDNTTAQTLEHSPENLIVPFTFADIPVRGKLLRLTGITQFCPSLTTATNETTQLLTDLLLVAVILVQEFKSGSDVSLQLQHQDGAVLVAQCNAAGSIRAYANEAAQTLTFADFHTNGTFTVNAIHHGELFQSIIPLAHPTLRQTVLAYFAQSVQSFTLLQSWLLPVGEHLHCGALFLQTLPQDGTNADITTDDWQRLQILADSLTAAEAAPGQISATEALHRLFHQDTVHVYPAVPIHFQQDDPRRRMLAALHKLGEETCQDLLTDGPIHMTDAYTGQSASFTREEIATLFAQIPHTTAS